MEDIIINGVSIKGLKAQRLAIRKGATEFISDSIESVKALVNQIVESNDAEEMNAKAKIAFDTLEAAKLVSDISGVPYYLPYNDDYGYSNGDAMTELLDDGENEALNIYGGDYVEKLYDLLGDMENEVRDWNTSRC
jgi:hypothetical protein